MSSTARIVALAACLALSGVVGAGAASPDPMRVKVDQAEIVEIERGASTVIVGNPAIVDVEVLSARRLVLTGKTYGVTNVVVLDQEGSTIVDQRIAVQSAETSTVRIYRQASRTTLACAPKCEPTITTGDAPEAFQQAAEQYRTRQSIAEAAAER